MKHVGGLCVVFGVIVVSDRIFKGLAKDASGLKAKETIEKEGYKVSYYEIVPNDIKKIRNTLGKALDKGCKIIILIGGSGIGPRDVTVEAVKPLFEKEIPGFGELFRMLSYQKIGSRTWLSRAIAGIYHNALIVVVPGSTGAVELALEEILLPEVDHVINMIKGVSHWDEKH